MTSSIKKIFAIFRLDTLLYMTYVYAQYAHRHKVNIKININNISPDISYNTHITRPEVSEIHDFNYFDESLYT